MADFSISVRNWSCSARCGTGRLNLCSVVSLEVLTGIGGKGLSSRERLSELLLDLSEPEWCGGGCVVRFWKSSISNVLRRSKMFGLCAKLCLLSSLERGCQPRPVDCSCIDLVLLSGTLSLSRLGRVPARGCRDVWKMWAGFCPGCGSLTGFFRIEYEQGGLRSLCG